MTDLSTHSGNGAAPPPVETNVSADEPPAWEYQEHALIVLPGVAWEEWVTLWNSTERMMKSHAFWVGDALLAGQREFGEKFAEVVEAHYIDQKAGPMWVCGKIPPSRRRPELSYSCHREVAVLEPADQEKMLALAVDNGWGSKEIHDEVTRRYPHLRRKVGKASTYPRNDPDPEEAEPEVPATERWPEPPPPISTVPEPERVDRGVAVRRPDSRGNLTRPDQEAIDAAEAARPRPLPETPDALFRSPEQVREALAEELRGMLGRYREIVGRLDEAGFGWLITIDDPTTNFAVALRRGNQIAVGNHEYVPLALAEAAIAALISDLGAQ